jgi:NADH-quinone oxidoreductase subunit D
MQCIGWLERNSGEISVNVKDLPAGEGIGRHEAPRGECFHYIKSDRTTKPVRHKVRSPSFMNVATNAKAVVGYSVSDALIVLGAVDPCYCCAERMAVVNAEDGKPGLTYNDLLRLSREKTEKLRKQL